jgi:hypothetical protein
MSKIFYGTQPSKFRPASLAIIDQANEICTEYARRGFGLTLRQLYYQFVARDLLANTQQSYSRLGAILNDARMAGLLDWSHLTDRTRNLSTGAHWTSPASILNSAAEGYAIDKWADQSVHVEVWVEKEALAGIVGRAAGNLDIGYLACRGYMSASEMWEAGQRFLRAIKRGKRVQIFHLGDHDPSGIDMTRDIRDRLVNFLLYDAATLGPEYDLPNLGQVYRALGQRNGHEDAPIIVDRIALNMDQIELYTPPPNPAKLTDSRAEEYIANFGDESWELDALDPDVLLDLITGEVEAVRDDVLYAASVGREEVGREWLRDVRDSYVDDSNQDED